MELRCSQMSLAEIFLLEELLIFSWMKSIWKCLLTPVKYIYDEMSLVVYHIAKIYNEVWMHHIGKCCRPIIVSVRLVKAENLDWRLFRVSDQRLIKWFRKSCRIFELGLHLKWAMPNSLPISIVYIQHCINSQLSRKLHFLPFKYCKPHKYAMSGGHFQCLRKLPRWTFGGFPILIR